MRQRRSRIQRALGMVGALFLVFLMPFASSQVASSKRQPSVVASGELSPAQAALSPILVTGDVPRPGAYTYHSQLRPRDYLLLAGLSPDLLEAPDRVQVEVLLPDGSAQPLSPAVQLSGGETLLVRRLALSEEEEGAVPTMEIEGPAVRVVGAVREPKVVPFVLAWSLEDYLQAAGGVPEEAGETTVWIQRESGAVRPATPDSLLRPGDTILVSETIPEAAVPRLPLPEAIEAVPAPEEGTVTVLGAVRQERSFAYRPELSAEDYIRLAGGFSPQADEEGVIVLHRDNTYGPITEPVRPGDLLFVPRIPIPRTAEQLREELSERRRVEEAARRRVLVEPTQRLSRFGWEFFAPARSRIQRIEQRIQRIAPSVSASSAGASSGEIGPVSPQALIRDAISGYVGPVDQLDAAVLMRIPHARVLRPYDELQVVWWSPTSQQPPQQVTLTVDPAGKVVLPGFGELVAAGMTLEQFEQNVQEIVARQSFQDVQVVAMVRSLETIQVTIVGQAYRPGTYAMGAAATLFNALYFAGGPSEEGSFRRITLKRGEERYTIDFYRYLLEGDGSADRTLQDGDLIYIEPRGATVTLSGEVTRPGIYELLPGEGLADLIRMAGGLRSTGFAKSVQIESVREGSEPVLLNVDATADLSEAPPLQDGDRVTVFPIASEPMNTVRVMGWVKQPRVYELKAGMRVSDAVRVAGGLRPEADRNRADVFRLNPDGETTTLIPVNLEAALSGDAEADVPLAPLDRLVVYRTNETRFVPSREVAVQGAVARPGSYPRADGMRLSDLLRLSGGVRDDAYRQRAMLMRLDDHGRLAVHQPVRLDRLEAGDPQEDPLLRDGDVLLVLRYEEAVWQPAQIVRVTGAVQEPGDVPFLEGMRVSDALLRAGGVEGDHADVALLLRKSERWDYVRTALTINLNAVLAGEESADLPLQPEDEIVVYRAPEVVWEPDPFVTVTGAVQRPDVYPRTEGMRISDLVFQAGGVLPNAYLSRADLIRYLDDYETQITIPVDLQAALAGDEGADLPLRDGDTLRILTIREALYYPEETVTIYGAVQRPDTYRWTEGMTLQDLLFVAGGVVPGHRPEVEIARARGEGRTEVFRVDLRTSTEGDLRNIPIYPGDVVSVLKSSTFYDVPRMVIVLGEVQYPGAYAIEGTDRISDLIERAGGLTKFAYAPGATLTRQADRLIRPERRATLQELWAIIEAQNRLEYQRALAKARVEAQQSGATVESLTEFVAETVAPVATIIGPEGATSSTPPQETSESDSVSPGEAAQVVTEVAQPAAQEEPFSVQLVTPARRIANLFPSNEVVIDLPEILEKRGSEVDLILEPGDVIYVPRVNNTVYIVGAVVSPKAVTYRKEWDLDDYLNQVGGLTQDADKDHIVVTRMNGRTIPKDKLKRIEPGDTISVPTRVLRERVTSRWDPLFSFLRFTVTTVATAVVIYAALNR